MSDIYGIRIFNTEQIKEQIQLLGLTDFSHSKTQGKLKSPSLDEIIDFVYYECIPVIPTQLTDAFMQQNRMPFFKRYIQEHLHFAIRMRMNFEYSLQNGPYKSLYDLLKTHVDYTEDTKYYDHLRKINDFYGSNYYKPTKSIGSGPTDPFLFPTFQERLYAQTIASRTSNPLYSQAKANYKNLIELHQTLSKMKENEQLHSLVSDYIIESTYSFDFLKYVSKYISKNQVKTVDGLKNIILSGLLPNIFTRDEFMNVLLTHSESCITTMDIAEFSGRYFQRIELETKGILHSSRAKNKKIFTNQYTINGILGNRLNEELKEHQESRVNRRVEDCLLSLIHFVFPLMEMYAYYLIKDIFTVDLQSNQFAYNYSIKTEVSEKLSQDEITIFDMIAPILFQLKKIECSLHLSISKENVESIKQLKSLTSNIITSEAIIEKPPFQHIYNQYIISQQIVSSSRGNIDEIFYRTISSDTFTRNFERIQKHYMKK